MLSTYSGIDTHGLWLKQLYSIHNVLKKNNKKEFASIQKAVGEYEPRVTKEEQRQSSHQA